MLWVKVKNDNALLGPRQNQVWGQVTSQIMVFVRRLESNMVYDIFHHIWYTQIVIVAFFWIKIHTTISGLCDDSIITCSRDVKLKPDTDLSSVSEKTFDIIILPGGGPGAKAFCAVSS